MVRLVHALLNAVLGPPGRPRVRVSQTLLGVPALLLIHCLLLVERLRSHEPMTPVLAFVVLSLIGCAGFYALVRSGGSERLSTEASLSQPQMAYAMFCVGWGYLLAGPWRAAFLPLMPLILSFGVFALEDGAVRRLAVQGILGMALVVAWRLHQDPTQDEALMDVAAWLFLAVAMGSISILARRMARMRSRLREQKSELSAALERIRLLATRDVLTGLLNRRAMQEELQRLGRQAQRHGRPLTLALADLDRFKQINDSYGHAVGDRVLQAFARVAERELRGADVVARWGGEEFLFALPDTDEEPARACLDRLRLALAEAGVDGLPPQQVIGFSAGVARCHGPEDIEAAIERADQAMYRAKLRGRGRTEREAGAETPQPA